MKVLIALVVIVAVLAIILWRRGSGGLGSSGHSDTEAGELGRSPHQQQNWLGGGGGA
ncbi:hypothetical protein BCF74_11552 [Knoellia remsis]|uniref:Uncharacterized protein n=1 Tax=Knoellia remsis TaxID=407159 RepID=A0A2T0UI41_9MICO|nr:hypothetical protein [Knoellia remsis]PRY57538.1 hypothetical protein BCF74_11552 [Knoellia remsis]